VAGLLCQNPQLSDRLGRYPAFLSLDELPEIQQVTQDNTFTKGWHDRAPMGQLLNEASVKTLLKNNTLVSMIWTTTETNLDDLLAYLKTGSSAKYDGEPILGRWDLNVNVTVAMLRQARPNIPAKEMQAVRALWTMAYAQTTFVAGSDHQAFLKNMPTFKPSQSPVTWSGTWSKSNTGYDLTLSGNGENKSLTAKVSGVRLTLKGDVNTLVFDHE